VFDADPTSPESEGIHEVLQNLDQATKDFTRRLDELAAVGAMPARNGADDPSEGPRPEPVPEAPATAPPEVEPSVVKPSGGFGLARAHIDLDRRMAQAEAEAQRYLEEAKQRADSMVQSIVNAVESEADAMRRDAEDGIRERWVKVEAEAERFLGDARRAADGIVENRQRRIAELSDTIVGLAGELTERMTNAAEMQRQFDALVVSLAQAAGRIAADQGTSAPPVADPTPKGSWRARVEAAEAHVL
jgi:F0F1-type ATP synthase membrane subunit b/b'